MQKIKVVELENEIARCAEETKDDPEFECGHCAQIIPLLRLARAAKAEDTQRTKILAGELKFPRDTEQ